MEIRKRFSGDIAVLYVSGKIDIDAAELIEETGHLAREGVKRMLCDFSGVTMIDYNGLSILSIAYKNVANQNSALKFCSLPKHVKSLFKMTKLNETFGCFSDEEDGIKNFDTTGKVDTLHLRRRFKRIDVGIPLKYKIGISTDAKLLKGKALNVGGDGLFILSKDIFPIGQMLYIELPIAGHLKPYTVMGTVIWHADKELQPHSYPGMGVEFTGMDKKAQTEIMDFVDKNVTGRSCV